MSAVHEMSTEQDQRISEAIETEQTRLRNFIRRRVPDPEDAEDILQEVFYELTETYRLMKPIEQVSAWLFRVARNRIIDLFRKRRSKSLNEPISAREEEDDELSLEDLLVSEDAGPEEAYARGVLLDALDDALEELPPEQRDVFIAHEFDGTSFKELAEETGIGMNTLLARKRYAVLHLRRRLQQIYEDFVKR
jgi:RNA polymerase sigma factor (sigma-70 family)